MTIFNKLGMRFWLQEGSKCAFSLCLSLWLIARLTNRSWYEKQCIKCVLKVS